MSPRFFLIWRPTSVVVSENNEINICRKSEAVFRHHFTNTKASFWLVVNFNMLNSGTSQQADDGKQKPSKGKTRHVSETFVQLTGNGSDNGKQNGGIGVAVDNKNPSTFEAQDDRVCTVCKITFNDETDKILECEVCCSRKCAKCHECSICDQTKSRAYLVVQ